MFFSLSAPTGVQAGEPGFSGRLAEMVLEHYTDLAEAVYGDSLKMARDLQKAVNQLLARPSEETLAAARAAWRASRVPYQQSEVYRFGNAIVDGLGGQSETPGHSTKA